LNSVGAGSLRVSITKAFHVSFEANTKPALVRNVFVFPIYIVDCWL
jgi:hypothetical protein